MLKKFTIIITVVLLLSSCTQENVVKNENIINKVENEDLNKKSETGTTIETDKIVNENNSVKNYYKSKFTTTKNGKQIYTTDFDVYEVDGVKYGLGTVGGDILEDGIIITLYIFNNNSDVSWGKTWNAVHLTELAPFSDATVHDNNFIIAVNKGLYSINLENLTLNWEAPIAYGADIAPIVHENAIYIIRQYQPYLTKVSLDGEKQWELRNEQLYGLHNVTFDGDKIITERYYIDETLVIENYENFLD